MSAKDVDNKSKDKTKVKTKDKVKDNKQKASKDKKTQSLDEKDVLRTVTYDPRFPNVNQTRNCYQNYLDYHRCLRVKNDETYCHYYQWAYRELCPRAWTDKWDHQRAEGIFAGRI